MDDSIIPKRPSFLDRAPGDMVSDAQWCGVEQRGISGRTWPTRLKQAAPRMVGGQPPEALHFKTLWRIEK